jgi:hypothetical protein
MSIQRNRNGVRALGIPPTALLLAALVLTLLPAGCRKPQGSAPLAPERRGPVRDLAAVRAGDELSLNWSMPAGITRKLAVDGSVTVKVCRRETPAGACNDVGGPLLLAPGATGSFSEQLPQPLVSGPPRLLYYFVELLDRSGRSTGFSNSVATLAGAPLPAVAGFSAEVTANGVLLHWSPLSPAEEPNGTILQLRRTRLVLAPYSPDPSKFSPSAATSEDGNRVIEVSLQTDHTWDTEIRPGDAYGYTAQRLVRIQVRNQVLELAGQLSPQLRVDIPAAALQHNAR